MEKNHVEAFLSLLTIGIAGIGVTVAALYIDLTIPSVGHVPVVAQSGSVKDIQAAVNQAISAGATDIYIPEGNWTFAANGAYGNDVGIGPNPIPTTGTNFLGINVPAQGLNIFGAGMDKTILDLPDNVTTPNTDMFVACGGYKESGNIWHFGGKLRISGIAFKGRNPTSSTAETAIRLISCKDFRVDNCGFYDMGGVGVQVGDQNSQYGFQGGDPNRISQGVVDHNSFYNMYKAAATSAGNGWGYGVSVSRAAYYAWIVWHDDIWNLLGKYNGNVFIEDNYFIGCRHAIASIGGGVYVFRHNTVEDCGMGERALTGHPVRADIYGMRANEVYDNTFTYTGSVKFHGPLYKGGGGVVFNNTMQNLFSFLDIGNCEANNVFYPRGNVKDLYIWNNSIIGCDRAIWVEDPYSTGNWTAPVAQEGTDWFSDLTGNYTTSQIQAMVDSHGYTPYPYPHHLTLEGTPP